MFFPSPPGGDPDLILRMVVCSGKGTRGPATRVPILWYTHYAALVPQSAPVDKGKKAHKGGDVAKGGVTKKSGCLRLSAILARGPKGDEPAVVLSGVGRLYSKLVAKEEEVSVYRQTHLVGLLPGVLAQARRVWYRVFGVQRLPSMPRNALLTNFGTGMR